ncbi:MAG: hypothetical protein Ta2E_03890 [Mycoplasmoidaceae bacterium]|nr:MAG: hypothetical protein Ta2E_03890 [Mycoplasmoidaceae bacterium]
MKKYIIKFLSYENDNSLFSSAFLANNKYLFIKNGLLFIRGDYMKTEQCSLEQELIDIDEEKKRDMFIDEIAFIIKESHEKIQNIPNLQGEFEEGLYGLKTEKDEKSIVTQAIMSMYYGGSQKCILNLIAHIVFNINSNHMYHNGNKRTALFSMYTILYYFGYYLAGSHTENTFLEFWEKFMCKIANYQNEKYLVNQKNTIDYIKDTLLKNVQIMVLKKPYNSKEKQK